MLQEPGSFNIDLILRVRVKATVGNLQARDFQSHSLSCQKKKKKKFAMLFDPANYFVIILYFYVLSQTHLVVEQVHSKMTLTACSSSLLTMS